jgi:hypothetical protein
MLNLTTPFIISQILILFAIVFDFLSFQFKERKKIYLFLIFSASLISAHYFLLNKITAWVIVCISVLRFITCYFTTEKKYLILFIALNTISLFFTYKEIYDLVIYIWLVIFIIWNFQEDNKLMRKLMMIWTFIGLLYNVIILSPMWVISQGSFLISNFIWYYRFYIKRKIL